MSALFDALAIAVAAWFLLGDGFAEMRNSITVGVAVLVALLSIYRLAQRVRR